MLGNFHSPLFHPFRLHTHHLLTHLPQLLLRLLIVDITPIPAPQKTRLLALTRHPTVLQIHSASPLPHRRHSSPHLRRRALRRALQRPPQHLIARNARLNLGGGLALEARQDGARVYGQTVEPLGAVEAVEVVCHEDVCGLGLGVGGARVVLAFGVGVGEVDLGAAVGAG